MPTGRATALRARHPTHGTCRSALFLAAGGAVGGRSFPAKQDGHSGTPAWEGSTNARGRRVVTGRYTTEIRRRQTVALSTRAAIRSTEGSPGGREARMPAGTGTRAPDLPAALPTPRRQRRAVRPMRGPRLGAGPARPRPTRGDHGLRRPSPSTTAAAKSRSRRGLAAVGGRREPALGGG